MKPGIRHWLNEVIENDKKLPLPILSYPGISLTGASVLDIVTDADAQSRTMKAVSERCRTLASVSLMDLSLEAECFGCEVKFSENEIPNVTNTIIKTEADADSLKVPELSSGRASVYIDAVDRASKLIDDRPVFAGIIGPFSLAARLIGVMDTVYACIDSPELVTKTVGKCTEFLINYANAYKNNTGAAGIIMAEPVTGLLSPDIAEEFSEPAVRLVRDAVADDGFIIIYHNCGESVPFLADSLLRTGCDAFHFGNAVDIGTMLSLFPENVPVLGNIDPITYFKDGTPDKMRSAVRELKESCRGHRNFILSSGCDIPSSSSWDNIDAFFEEALA